MIKKNNRLAELDALRGIAAICVVVFHFTSKFREDYGYHFTARFDWDFGHYGVELFFVISGFVIFMTLQKVNSVADFAYKRFSRLFPSYWICIVLTTIAISIFGLPGKMLSTKQVLLNFTMIQGLLKVNNVDGSYWSLLPEICFYVLLGLIFYFKLLSRIRVIGVFWLLFILINQFHHLNFLSTVLNLRYGMLFFAGILFFKLKYDNDSPIINNILILICAVSAVAVNPSIEYLIVIAILLGTFFLFVNNKLTFIAIKPLLFLGYVSYPLYLIHQYIGYIIILKLDSFHVNEIVSIFMALVFSIALAWVITEYLEKPIHIFLRKLGSTRRLNELN